MPDPDLRWNDERQAYDYTQPDYDELMRVIKGDGPCNRQRMAHRRARPRRRRLGARGRRGLRRQAAAERAETVAA